MGELHLEIIVDRLKREFNVDANVGRPQVAYRETVGEARREDPGQVRPPDGRLGPVRRRRHQPAAAGAGQGLRVRRQDRRRQDPQGVHQADRRGHPRGDGQRRPRRLPGRRRQGRADRRQLPRRRLERARVQDRRLDGLQGSDEAREAEAPRADDGRRGDDARGLPRRRDGQPELPPRAHREHVARRQRAGDQGERPAERDVRLRHRPAVDVPGPRRFHHAVRPVRGSAGVDRDRDHRAGLGIRK